MERMVTDTGVLYQQEDGTVYLITPITPIAGVLGVTGMPEDPRGDLKYIWEDSGIVKLILFCPADQPEYVKACRSVGFKQEGRLKNATPEGDLLVFGQYR